MNENFKIKWFDEVKSTNDTLAEMIAENHELKGGLVVAANRQTKGRGRSGRVWQTFAGESLCFSVLITSKIAKLQTYSSLPMCFALAVRHVLVAYGLNATIKWPNDVLINDKKICGILSEQLKNHKEGLSFVVGVGVNVGMGKESLDKIDRPSTSIMFESGDDYPPNKVLDKILAELKPRLKKWEKQGFSAIKDEWLKAGGNIGQKISVHQGIKKISGIVYGYGSSGELLLLNNDGDIKQIWSGEISLT